MRICNQEFADTNLEFREACGRAGVVPSKRRAAKWRLGTGYVYGFRIGGPQGPAAIASKKEEQLVAAAR
jgi:hypothetical protein